MESVGGRVLGWVGSGIYENSKAPVATVELVREKTGNFCLYFVIKKKNVFKVSTEENCTTNYPVFFLW